jgi:hypothetical protein
MSGRRINSAESPVIRRWRVIEVEKQDGSRSRHIWGHDIMNDSGMASTAIREFDWTTMTATTLSGHNYTLVGIPGNSHALERVWHSWCHLHGVIAESDVTDEYFDVDKVIGS